MFEQYHLAPLISLYGCLEGAKTLLVYGYKGQWYAESELGPILESECDTESAMMHIPFIMTRRAFNCPSGGVHLKYELLHPLFLNPRSNVKYEVEQKAHKHIFTNVLSDFMTTLECGHPPRGSDIHPPLSRVSMACTIYRKCVVAPEKTRDLVNQLSISLPGFERAIMFLLLDSRHIHTESEDMDLTLSTGENDGSPSESSESEEDDEAIDKQPHSHPRADDFAAAITQWTERLQEMSMDRPLPRSFATVANSV
jgi:hypothetical protein